MGRFSTDARVPLKILAFDTAMSSCSVAYACLGTGIFHEKVIPMTRGQAETLVPMIDEIMQEAGVAYESLDAIATTVGPGAFTGLRIGLSTARALGMALDIDVYGFSTLDLITQRFIRAREAAQGHDIESRPILVVLETKRNDYYTQLYAANGSAVTEALALNIDQIYSVLSGSNLPDKSIMVIGDAVGRFEKESRKYNEGDFAYKLIHCNEYCLPDPADMVRMLDRGHKALPAEPLYLREADVSKAKKKYRTIDNLK